MLIEINLERNFKNKLVYENCVLKKLYAYSYRVLIKRVIMFLKLLYEDFISLMIKDLFYKVKNSRNHYDLL